MNEDTKQILEIITDIQENMMTRTEGSAMKTTLQDNMRDMERRLMSEIRDIRAYLEYLKEKVNNMSGYAKELDPLFERVANIEKHLNIA